MSADVTVPALLAFIGSLLGAVSAVRYARRKAFEEAVGGIFARRRLELVESLACLLGEVIDVLDQIEGAEPLRKARDDREVLADLARALPLVHIYFSDELYGLLNSIHFWTWLQLNPNTNYVHPKTPPDHERAWKLLSQAARQSQDLERKPAR